VNTQGLIESISKTLYFDWKKTIVFTGLSPQHIETWVGFKVNYVNMKEIVDEVIG